MNFSWGHPSQENDNEVTEEQQTQYLRDQIQSALLGNASEDTMFVVSRATHFITQGTYSKEELGLTEETFLQLQKLMETWVTKKRRIQEIRSLYGALQFESNKLYLFRAKKKRVTLRRLATQLKVEMALANLTYRDCQINGEFVKECADL